MAKKPWRVIGPVEDAGRFTASQYLAAVEAVKAQKEAESKARRAEKPRRKTSATRASNSISGAGHDPDTV